MAHVITYRLRDMVAVESMAHWKPDLLTPGEARFLGKKLIGVADALDKEREDQRQAALHVNVLVAQGD